MRTLAVVMAMLVVAAAAAGVAAVPNDESETETPGGGPAAGTGSGGGEGGGGWSGSGGGDGTVTGGGDSGTVAGGNVTGGPGPGNPNPNEGSSVEKDGTFTVRTGSIDVHQEEGGRICADKKEPDVNKVTIYESTLHNSTVWHDNDDGNDIQIDIDSADVDKVVMWTNGENQMVNALALTGQCIPFDQPQPTTVEAYRLESETMVADNQTLRAGNGLADGAPEPGGLFVGDALNNSTGVPVQPPGNVTDGVPVNETVDNVSGTVGGVVDNTTDLANGTLNGTADQVQGTAGQATDQVDQTVNGTTDQVDDATNGSTEPVTSPVDNTTDGATDTVRETANGTTSTVENATNDTQSVVNETVQTASQTTGNTTDSVTSAVEGATNESDGASTLTETETETATPTPTPSGPVEPVVQFPSCTEAQVNGTWDRVQVRTHGYGPTGDLVRENLSTTGSDGLSLTDSLADGLLTDDTSLVDLADTSLAGDDHVIDAVALGETDDGEFERVVEHPDASSCDADVEPDDTTTSTDSDGVTDSTDDSSSDDGSSDGDDSSDDGSLLYLVPDPVLATVA